ncbi:hypothetical protein NQ318_005983 [Aromia moschata]|uniref:Uncharacterized protein n=1 Tax=Aromia moschata TaxID=1265417 RepID=A0AAV8XYA6_9CUCU|nr:hypothetical protein NQ318_005983 [Aromia moschata]
MKLELLDGAPPGTIAGSSGWIQQHLFTQWLNHFVKHTNEMKHANEKPRRERDVKQPKTIRAPDGPPRDKRMKSLKKLVN